MGSSQLASAPGGSRSFSPHSSPSDRKESQGSKIAYRPAERDDFHRLRDAHVAMFPVDYEDSFFERAVQQQDNLLSLMAVSREPGGTHPLVGFVVARAFKLHECDLLDRELMGLGHKLLEHELAMYILTLGVEVQARRNGIASRLIQWVIQQAESRNCRAVYLHAISYNHAAMSMYRRNGFQEIAMRPNFYYLSSRRQPDPSQEWYDAFLYAYLIDTEVRRTPIIFILALLAPLRDLVYMIRSIFPNGTPKSTYFGNTDSLATAPSPPSIQHQTLAGANTQYTDSRLEIWLKSLFSRKEEFRRQ